MKYPHSNNINLFAGLLSLILFLSLIKDGVWINNFVHKKTRLHHYINYENENLDASNLGWVNYIKTYIQFIEKNYSPEYAKYDTLENANVYEIAKWSVNPNPMRESMNFIDTTHGTEEIKRRIINTQLNFLIPHYEKKLLTAYLEILAYKLNPPETGDYLSKFEFSRPVTEDSIYFGSMDYNGEKMSRFKFRINQNDFHWDWMDDTIKVALADTLHIETILTSFIFTRIDTLTSVQTIAKRNGRWWNINSPDPK